MLICTPSLVRESAIAGQAIDRAPSDGPRQSLLHLAARYGHHYYLMLDISMGDAPIAAALHIGNLRRRELLACPVSVLFGERGRKRLQTSLRVQSGLVAPDDPAFRREFERASMRTYLAQSGRLTDGSSATLVIADACQSPDREASAQFAQDALALMETLSPPRHDTPVCPMSLRERECLTWAAEGKTSEETALILGISAHTVQQHLGRAMVGLAASNRANAVAKAMQAGWITPRLR